MFIDFLNQLVRVYSVYHACLGDSFAARCGASKAMHAHLKEKGGGCVVHIQNIADNRIFCNLCHIVIPPFISDAILRVFCLFMIIAEEKKKSNIRVLPRKKDFL
jgi:hypothetical protein